MGKSSERVSVYSHSIEIGGLVIISAHFRLSLSTDCRLLGRGRACAALRTLTCSTHHRRRRPSACAIADSSTPFAAAVSMAARSARSEACRCKSTSPVAIKATTMAMASVQTTVRLWNISSDWCSIKFLCC